jgi:hypothetical protein
MTGAAMIFFLAAAFGTGSRPVEGRVRSTPASERQQEGMALQREPRSAVDHDVSILI